MTQFQPAGRELARGAGAFALHAAAIIVGLFLMIMGLGMGVTVVMLPVGIPVGVVGLFVLLWGISGHPAAKEPPPPMM